MSLPEAKTQAKRIAISGVLLLWHSQEFGRIFSISGVDPGLRHVWKRRLGRDTLPNHCGQIYLGRRARNPGEPPSMTQTRNCQLRAVTAKTVTAKNINIDNFGCGWIMNPFMPDWGAKNERTASDFDSEWSQRNQGYDLQKCRIAQCCRISAGG